MSPKESTYSLYCSNSSNSDPTNLYHKEINNLFNDHFGLSNTNETPLPDHGICITESEDNDTSIGNEIQFKQCNCEHKCTEKFSSSDINDHIVSIRDMLKEEKEQLIMTILNTVKISDADTRRGSRKRPTYLYCFEGKKICRQAFMILYDITDFSLRALCEHVHGHGVSPRKHGNTGRKPIHALHFDDVMKIVTFLRSYADENGLPQPAAPRGRGDLPPIYLHSSLKKKAIHSIYVESLRSENGKCVKRTTFCQIWKACVPHIVIASPRHDVCSKCEQYRKKIVDAVTESEKMAATSSMQTHIQLAQEERNLYLTLIRQSKKALETAALLGNIPSTMHYAFDFAQNVTLPHHARQMGPLYFLSLKKVQVFGFRTDGDPRQLIYLLDESQCIGVDGKLSHGPNAVISMMHHAFQRVGKQEDNCSLHADNCAGQNKNRYVLAYLSWRVMTGLHKKIDLHMQIPGHSRCLVDAGFANFKRLYRRCDADSLLDLVNQVFKSSTVNESVSYPEWTWFDWKTYFNQYYKALPGISSYQHFRIEHNRPGEVTVRKTPDGDERSFKLLRHSDTTFTAEQMPPVLLSGGLSFERQLYLYRSVRPYVRQNSQDETCPLPTREE